MCCLPRSGCLFPPSLHCSCVLDLSVMALRLSNFYIIFHFLFSGCAQLLSVFTLGSTKTQKVSFLQTRTSYFFGFVPPLLPQANPVFGSKEDILVKLKPFGVSLVYQEQTRSLPSVSQTKETERGVMLRNEKNKSRFICFFSDCSEFRYSVAVAGRRCKSTWHVKISWFEWYIRLELMGDSSLLNEEGLGNVNW